MKHKIPALVLLIGQIVFCQELAIAEADRPNVVLIMADDLGYADLGCYGSEKIRTPVLDKLATDGIRLTDFYAGCTVCTPSRMALLTGAYPVRLGWPGGVSGYRIDSKNGLNPKAVTIAEAFKASGYQTGISGKWHLGDTHEHSPMQQGFDSALFIKRSNNQTTKLWRGEQLVADPFDNRLLTSHFASDAIRFINANHDKPFFLYMPFTAPHFPAQAHPDWKGRTPDAYSDVVEELDSAIGSVLASLSASSVADNTIVVFLSDNGVEPGQKKWARSTPYRGLKWSSLEGGNRVPCIVRWKERIPGGQTCDELVAAIDLFPTLAAACQVALPDLPYPLDGVNVLNTLTGQDPAAHHPRQHLLFWNGWSTFQAIRSGRWKLYVDQIKELPASTNGPVLIDLVADPRERNNLATTHLERVKTMLTEAGKQLVEIRANSIPLGGPVVDSNSKPAAHMAKP